MITISKEEYSRPVKLIILNEELTIREDEYPRIPRAYLNLIRLTKAYYYNSNMVIEAVGKEVLIRRAIPQDYINLSSKLRDYKANKIVLVESKPIQLKRINPMLDLISRERTYNKNSIEVIELLNILYLIEIDTSRNNSAIIKNLINEGVLEVEIMSITLMSRVSFKGIDRCYRFYDLMDALNMRIINKR